MHSQVETKVFIGALMMLSITAYTLMLYSRPGSNPLMVVFVTFPGTLISSWTPPGVVGA